MKTARNNLEREFTTDHRGLTQGFARLLELLQSGENDAARDLADHIDQVAGPHIEFEETVLYPAVSRAESSDFTARLYSEHQIAFEAVTWLRSHPAEGIDDATRRRLIEQVQTGLDHAMSCGSLTSYLTTLDESQYEILLGKLHTCREAGHRWSEWQSLQNRL